MVRGILALSVPPRSPTPSIWLTLLAVAMAVHLLFGIQRLLIKSLPRRIEQKAAMDRLGPIRFHLEAKYPLAVEAVLHLQESTPEDSLILFRGNYLGVPELVTGLLAPRLLYFESSAPAGATSVSGRQLASGRLPGGSEKVGTLVLVADSPRALHLEHRVPR